jgi:hypothetical protein
VFYTNSRYAKVGGLPPHELNQLELQFLLLNDFRLVIPREEMQRYGDRLLGYSEEGSVGVEEELRARVVSAKAADTASTETITPSRPDEATSSERTASERMEVDQPEQDTPKPTPMPGHSTSAVKATTPAESTEPPSAHPASTITQPVAPRGRERNTRPSSISFAPTPSAASIRGYGRSDVGIGGAIGSRIASPVRD